MMPSDFVFLAYEGIRELSKEMRVRLPSVGLS